MPLFRWIGRAIVALSWAATLALAVILLHELLLRTLAHRVAASVVAVEERRTADSYEYWARYSYNLPGAPPRADVSRLSYAEFHRLAAPFLGADRTAGELLYPAGAPGSMPIFAVSLGPITYSRAVEHHWGFMLLLIPAIFTPTLAFLSYTLHLAIITRPRRYRRLFTHGIAVPGTILDKRETVFTDSVDFSILYEFTPRGASEPMSGSSMLWKRGTYDKVAAGERVTVLYNPEDPKQNAMYEYGGYVVA